jgi:hypothetical protein
MKRAADTRFEINQMVFRDAYPVRKAVNIQAPLKTRFSQ